MEAQGMVTKIAAAIAEVHLHGPEDPVFDFYALTEEVADEYYEMAIAAIKAMREPTEKMIAEMESAATFGIGRPNDDEAIPRLWNWAIDAALNEQEKRR